jgi:voltage-gated potassium channel
MNQRAAEDGLVENATLRERVRRVIFETDTPLGRRFDVVLIWAILISVAAVMLESVESIRDAAAGPLHAVE